jgi:hypothetical protein
MRPTLPEEAWPLDRERWDSAVATWKAVEDLFDREPAEALRQAERLCRDLAGQRDDSASSTVRAAMRLTRSPSGQKRLIYTGEGDFLSAIPDFLRGLSEVSRQVRQARAAARGIEAARNHGAASIDDFQEAMTLYRGLFERILSVKREELDSLVPRAHTAAAESGPDVGPPTDDPAAEVRDRAIATRIVRESMGVIEQAEARSDRWRTFRWGVLGLAGNLAVGLAILLVVLWVLSQQ